MDILKEADYIRKFIPICQDKKRPTCLFIFRLYRVLLNVMKIRQLPRF